MLVRLLSPLAEADEHEVLLEVALLLRQRVEARVLDRHRGLQRESLRALDLVGRERTQPVPLREHGGADRLPVCPQRQSEQRAYAESARITGTDKRAGSRRALRTGTMARSARGAGAATGPPVRMRPPRTSPRDPPRTARSGTSKR